MPATVAAIMCPGKAKRKPGKPGKLGKVHKLGKPGKARPMRSKSLVKLEPLDGDQIKRQRAKSECFSEGSECDLPVSARTMRRIKARARAAEKASPQRGTGRSGLVFKKGLFKQRGRPGRALKMVASPRSVRVPSKADLLKKKGKKVRVTKDQIAFQKNFVRSSWAKRLVWRGKKVRTSGGLTSKDLMAGKTGKIVSKTRNRMGSRMYTMNHLDLWTSSLMRTRGEMGCKGFVKVKKAGTRVERALWEDTCKGWMDMVALRVVKMMQKSPQLLGKVNQRLLTPSGKSSRPSTSSQVKDE